MEGQKKWKGQVELGKRNGKGKMRKAERIGRVGVVSWAEEDGIWRRDMKNREVMEGRKRNRQKCKMGKERGGEGV